MFFLIDEAHNLSDRAREMYSATLEKGSFLSVKKSFQSRGKKVAKAASDLNALFVRLKKQCRLSREGYFIEEKENSEFLRLVNRFVTAAEKWLAQHREPSELSEILLELYFKTLAFLKISAFYDERYVTFVKSVGNEVELTLFCLDPSYLLSQTLKKGKAAVFFSATLTPLGYFRNLLGGSAEDRLVRLGSPFNRNRLCLLIADGVSTKFRDRPGSLSVIAAMIRTFSEAKKGNYIVFFPSYKYMNDVFEAFSSLCPSIQTIRQQTNMADSERDDFLKSFSPENDQILVGFCVLGGIFSEGIDLKGERLLGTVIVGVGLPQISPEVDIIRNYYENKNGMGFEYAYMYPGMNKVLQAAGRVIRSESDRGAILLIDDRLTRRDYQSLFPEHWNNPVRVANTSKLKLELDRFWNTKID